MSTYEIKVDVQVVTYNVDIKYKIGCYFSFRNPITRSTVFLAEFKESEESGMEFIKRIKDYINSKLFLEDVKQTIINDVEAKRSKDDEESEVEKIKEELDGLSFTVKVEMGD